MLTPTLRRFFHHFPEEIIEFVIGKFTRAISSLFLPLYFSVCAASSQTTYRLVEQIVLYLNVLDEFTLRVRYADTTAVWIWDAIKIVRCISHFLFPIARASPMLTCSCRFACCANKFAPAKSNRINDYEKTHVRTCMHGLARQCQYVIYNFAHTHRLKFCSSFGGMWESALS